MTTSVFPSGGVDTFTTQTDVSSSDASNISTYQNLLMTPNLTTSQQTQLASLTQTLSNAGKIVTADALNHMTDAIIATQSYYLNTVNTDITNMENTFSAKIAKFSNQGAYNPATTYMNMNFVTWNGQSYICTVDNTLNIDPSHNSNWTLIAAQGAIGPTGPQGASGSNVAFLGAYSSTATYSVNQAVQYQGSVYACTVNGTININPTQTSNWTLFVAQGQSTQFNSLVNTVTLGSSATNVSIGIAQYNSTSDTLLVFKSGTFLTKGIDYTLDANLTSIDVVSGSWSTGTEFTFIVLKTVSTSVPNSIDGSLIQTGTVANSALVTDAKVGSLATLTTSTKSDAVSAINEVKSETNTNQTNISTNTTNITTNTTNIGTLASLATTAKSNLVAAINEVKSESGVISVNGQTGAVTVSTGFNALTSPNAWIG